ncbi:MAG: hypothetical protein ABJC98_13830 [Bacteroidota bacterium]
MSGLMVASIKGCARKQIVDIFLKPTANYDRLNIMHQEKIAGLSLIPPTKHTLQFILPPARLTWYFILLSMTVILRSPAQNRDNMKMHSVLHIL